MLLEKAHAKSIKLNCKSTLNGVLTTMLISILGQSMTYVANFLATLYREDLTYSTICDYRSAVSSIHDLVDGKKVGEHSQLDSLLMAFLISSLL